ncbi:PREDICTED: zinc finger CCCH domain-containing protein 10, partial [Nipponia nippon]
MPDRASYNNGSSGDEVGANADDICRDFLRNVCKRGKRCRFRHPDISEVTNLGVRKNEFIFCHDFQNKECVRLNCRFIHGTKEDEDCYKKTGELPPRLRQKVAAGLGLSPADLPNSKEEVPICRDFLKGDCQRGAKCKFQHLQRDYEYDARGLAAREQGIVPAVRRYDDHDPVLKRRRVDGLHFETYEYSFASPRTVEYRLLEEENIMLRKRVEDLKKQVNNLLATNEVLLEQNAQFRNQAKVMTLSSTATATEQTLAPTVGTVTNYNHSIAQTHTTLSSQALQPRPVSQQDLVAPAGAQAAPPANAAPPMNPEITPLSAALAQTIAQGMAPPVSMAPVAVSVAPVAVSMAPPLGGVTLSRVRPGKLRHGAGWGRAPAASRDPRPLCPQVSFPDVERAEWLNKILAQAWPFFGQYMEKLLVENVAPSIRASNTHLQTFTFTKVDMGEKHVLRIHLLEAENLIAKDNFFKGVVRGRSDPYAKVRVAGRVFRSRVIKEDLNPRWNEVYEVIVDNVPGQDVEFDLFDKDIDKDDFLGR